MNTSFGVFSGSNEIDTTQNCGILVPLWNSWTNWICEYFVDHLIACACEHPGQMYLQLRGLCPDSKIDRFYIPRNKEKSGAVQLLGFDSTIIEYDKRNFLWMLNTSSRTWNTSAVSEAPLDSYVLGSHKWTINNDVFGCSSRGEAYQTVLKLTGCSEGQFTCGDGQCIRWVLQFCSANNVLRHIYLYVYTF